MSDLSFSCTISSVSSLQELEMTHVSFTGGVNQSARSLRHDSTLMSTAPVSLALLTMTSWSTKVSTRVTAYQSAPTTAFYSASASPVTKLRLQQSPTKSPWCVVRMPVTLLTWAPP